MLYLTPPPKSEGRDDQSRRKKLFTQCLHSRRWERGLGGPATCVGSPVCTREHARVLIGQQGRTESNGWKPSDNCSLARLLIGWLIGYFREWTWEVACCAWVQIKPVRTAWVTSAPAALCRRFEFLMVIWPATNYHDVPTWLLRSCRFGWLGGAFIGLQLTWEPNTFHHLANRVIIYLPYLSLQSKQSQFLVITNCNTVVLASPSA